MILLAPNVSALKNNANFLSSTLTCTEDGTESSLDNSSLSLGLFVLIPGLSTTSQFLKWVLSFKRSDSNLIIRSPMKKASSVTLENNVNYM